jgi:guanylate kinase
MRRKRLKKFDQKYLVVVSGPSGCGKDTVVMELMRRRPDIELAVSMTSRPKRDYEIEGNHYYFVSREEFELRISEEEMVEYTEYAGNYYGTPKKEIEDRLVNRQTVVLVIEFNGAKRIKEMYPDSLLVFIVPPSLEELERRLRLRDTEENWEVEKRLEIAKEELKHLADYDFVIENEKFRECAKNLEDTINFWQSKKENETNVNT